MIPKLEKRADGWYVEVDWDYMGNDQWAGPFMSENAALDWYWRVVQP